jgi:SNF family Na+-dependent transporter
MYFGAIALVLPLVIYMYYVLIEAWCLGYAINYATGDLVIGGNGRIDAIATELQETSETPMSDSEATSAAFGEFFERFVGMKENGALLKERNLHWFFMLIGTFLLNFVLIYRGVTKGIEAFCRVAMPLMVVLAVIVLFRVLTLGTPDPSQPDRNVINGLGAMWNPLGDKLWDPQTWLAASGQIFFSLSVGFGIIINYASYLTEKDDVVLSGLSSSSMNEFFEVCLGGLITLPAAFIFLGVAASGFGTFGLGFVALPNVFGQMAGGQLFGFLWFAMLFIAAVTSSVSMLQPVIAFLEEGFGLKRHASAAVLGLITALGCGFVLFFSQGLLAMETFDFWVGTFLIYVLAMFQAVLYGWIFGIERGDTEAHKGAHIRIPKFVQWMLKYVVPAYLLVIFVAFCWEKLPSKETEVFETGAAHTQVLQEKRLDDALREEFASQEHALPEEAVVTSVGPNGPWTIRTSPGDDTPLFVVRMRTESDQLIVHQYALGYVETIARNPVVLSSVGFIALVVAFLLLLIHIAGQRWEAEGRFAVKGEHELREGAP